jgi:hypothetical protein
MTIEEVISKLEERKKEYLNLQEKATEQDNKELGFSVRDFCSGMVNAFEASLYLIKNID